MWTRTGRPAGSPDSSTASVRPSGVRTVRSTPSPLLRAVSTLSHQRTGDVRAGSCRRQLNTDHCAQGKPPADQFSLAVDSSQREDEPGRAAGQRRSRPAEDTPGLTGLNVVGPRGCQLTALARCGRSTLTPATGPALTGTCPGTPGTPGNRPPPRPGGAKTSTACQGSSAADPSRIKWSQAVWR